eukprot:6213991-Amphidinium_carterae.1
MTLNCPGGQLHISHRVLLPRARYTLFTVRFIIITTTVLFHNINIYFNESTSPSTSTSYGDVLQ